MNKLAFQDFNCVGRILTRLNVRTTTSESLGHTTIFSDVYQGFPEVDTGQQIPIPVGTKASHRTAGKTDSKLLY